MKKNYVKGLVLGAMSVLLAGGTALAGTTSVNHQAAANTATVALEAMASAQNITIAGASNAADAAANTAVAFVLGQNLATGNLLKVNMTNMGFDGSVVNVCVLDAAALGANALGTATPTLGLTSTNFQIDLSVAGVNYATSAGDVVYLTNDACDGAAAGNFTVQAASTSSPTTGTITIGLNTAGDVVVDPSDTANAVSIQSEYTLALTSNDAIVIDYLGTPGDGTQLTTGVIAGSTSAANIALTTLDLGTSSTLGSANAGLTVASSLAVTDSQNWQGVDAIWIPNAANSCADGQAAANVIDTAPSGTVTLATTFDGSVAILDDFCVEVAGVEALNTRSITGVLDVTVTSGNNPTSATGDVQNWGLNGYQSLLPLVQKNSSAPVFCVASNGGTNIDADVFLNVLASADGPITTQYSLGTIATGMTETYMFDANGVTQLSNNTVTPLADITASGAARYSATITIAADQDNVAMTCLQTDPTTGSKRALPVLTVEGGPRWKN